jgi:putative SOS response-associated peptidase YedK
MCGRFFLATPIEAVAQLFGVGRIDALPRWQARYNIAPSQLVPVIREHSGADARERTLALARWGLVPSWADDPAIGNRMINARAESIESRPAFRQAFEKRRCIVPADGFFEWKRTGSRMKQPMAIRSLDGRPLAMAGLWERWRSTADEPWLETCTILTCPPNGLLREVHDRMPVVLEREGVDDWLNPDAKGGALRALLRPYPSERMSMVAVGRHVNTPEHDDPRCIEEVHPGPSSQEESLF